MAKQVINVGVTPNDNTGDYNRDAFIKTNANFTELYNTKADLGGDGRLLPAQAPLVYAAVLPTTAHTLNDYVTPGVWYQASIAGATAGGASYPTAQVGFLEVVATGTPVLQVYTTRNATPAIMQRFWRVRVTSTTWSNWKEVVDKTTTLSYAGRLATAQNLDTYTTRGIWFASAASIATGGTNYPVGTAGFLIVLSESELGGAAQTSGVSQRYESVNGKVYTRYISGGVWTPWVTLIDSSAVGVAGGVAGLDTNTRLPNVNFPLSVSISGGTNANDLSAPGVYYLNSDAAATAVLNWPEQIAGTLSVEAAVSGNQQITQTYTTRNGTGGVLRTYKRVRFGGGGGAWGLWQELARRADAMTQTTLAVGSDANTLTAANTQYIWTNGAVVSGGSNWPAVGFTPSRGFLDVTAVSGSQFHQKLTLLLAAAVHPVVYERYGVSGGTWYGWRIAGPISLTAYLPTADYGDVYVDGAGWYAWNGSAYAATSMTYANVTALGNLAFGRGQSWVDVSGQRGGSTNYVNSTGRPIIVSLTGVTGADAILLGRVNGILQSRNFIPAAIGGEIGINFIVPPGDTYMADWIGITSIFWAEYR